MIRSTKALIIFILITLNVNCTAAPITGKNPHETSASFKLSTEKNTSFHSEKLHKYKKQLDDLFEKIYKEYVEEPDKQKMVDAAINGILTVLDPHSYYLTDEALSDFINQAIEGHFGGIGVEIIYEDGAIKIIAPIDDLPAQKAGIKAGDYIVSVNDESVKNLGFHKAFYKMRGEPGTKVKLTIIREGANQPIELTITRELVKIKSVKYKNDRNIAYVRISTFNENTINELKKAFTDLKKDSKLEGIVLDLRNNPGGLLDQGIKVAEYFIDSGVVVSTRGRIASTDAIFTSNIFADKAPKLNMVTLINSGSASASEIVAGALQDHARSIIMGSKSFGKGSVQSLIRIDERSAIKLTTAKYYTPKGRSIQAEGINPDIIVEMAKVEYQNPEEADKKKFFEKSYTNHLKGDGNNKTPEKKADANKDDKNSLSEMYKTDYQYARAYDLLKALNIIQSNQ